MQAVVKTTPSPGICVMDVEMPAVGPDDVLVEVKAAGICGSDVHICEWTRAYHWMRLPLVLGHEFAGRICEVGSAVVGLSVGDRVVGDPYVPCGSCWNCRRGLFQLCDRGQPTTGRPPPGLQLGFRRNGGMAEYIALPARNVYMLPDCISDEVGGMLECFAVGFHAVERSVATSGDSAVILGPGPIGLSILLGTKALGIGSVTVLGMSQDTQRLRLAKELGAHQVIDIEKEDPVQRIRAITGGPGADVVFDATGAPDSVGLAVRLLRAGGQLVMAGISATPNSIAFDDVVRKELTITGIYGNLPITWKRVISLVGSNHIPLEHLITHILPLADAVQAFELARMKQALKVVLVPA